MNARSRYVRTHAEEVTDCRGHARTIRRYTGANKGKTYKYRSKKRGG